MTMRFMPTTSVFDHKFVFNTRDFSITKIYQARGVDKSMKNNKFKTTLKKPIVDRFFERAYLVVCVFFTLLGLSTSANASELSLQEAITKTLEQHPELTIFNYERLGSKEDQRLVREN